MNRGSVEECSGRLGKRRLKKNKGRKRRVGVWKRAVGRGK